MDRGRDADADGLPPRQQPGLGRRAEDALPAAVDPADQEQVLHDAEVQGRRLLANRLRQARVADEAARRASCPDAGRSGPNDQDTWSSA